LIDADSVLTAAHCVRGKPAWSLSVVVGRTVLDSTKGQLRNVSRINVYPGFNPATQAYDVAVLRLSSRVVGIAPIKLATATQNYLETPGRTATAAGWGNTIGEPAGPSAAGSYPQRMREARVPLVSDAYTYRVYTYYFPALMVAAGRTGKDTCQGDSGGPLFTWVPGSGYTQVGITSFGIGCGAPGYPGVYAEVNNPTLRSFITYWAAR
jgi:secreted trypsin-like serine protease